ncbi:methyltransferase domain-containing protein [Myxococcaceae bacterium GXIMD 01537]
MESAAEARRLSEQAKALPVHQHLVTAGLSRGMSALDAGCGPGSITSLMADLVGPEGRVVGLDLHEQRLQEARALCAHQPNARFVRADVRETGLPEASFDFVWSQYVFEYLPDPERALAELIRVTRPGGRVVVADVDGLGLHNWPFPPDLEEGCRTFMAALAAARFDLYVGRKMFHLYRKAGLDEVRVHVAPLWVVAGSADARLVEDWRQRFATLEPVVAPAFGGVDAYRTFSARYLSLLSDADALKYAVLLITEGRKR